MKWYDIIKAPRTFKGKTWKFFSIDDVPHLEELLYAKDVPWEDIWPTASRKLYFDKDQTFTPRINASKGGFGFWGIMNITTGKLVDDGWEAMRTKESITAQSDPESITEAQWGSGMNSLELTNNQIGIEVIKYGSTPVVEVTIPPETNIILGEKRNKDFMQNPGKYSLNNGEAAALAILGIFAEQRNPRLRKERIKLFDEFGIGPLEKESPSKYLRSLDTKGLVEYGSDRDDISRTNRGFPTITMDGYREATAQVDMPRAVFFSTEMEEGPEGMTPFGFKAKVLKQPDAPYMGYEGGAVAEG